MLLSTSIPTPSASPPRLIRFSDTPSNCSGTKVASSEIGIDTAITAVARRSRRKNSSTSTASAPPSSVFACTTAIADSMKLLWLLSTTTDSPGVSFSDGSPASTSPATATVFASPSRYTASSTASRPPTSASSLRSSGARLTRATSPSLSSAPARLRTITSRSASGVRASWTVRTRYRLR